MKNYNFLVVTFPFFSVILVGFFFFADFDNFLTIFGAFWKSQKTKKPGLNSVK